MMRMDSIITLMGPPNCGKTTSLINLIFDLAPQAKQHLRSLLFNNSTKKYRDAMVILTYQGKTIFISTFGDTRILCERNWHFFHLQWNNISQTVIYFVNGSNVTKLDRKGRAQWLEQHKGLTPDICISPCHDTGITLDVQSYYCRVHAQTIGYDEWFLHKFQYEPDPIVDNDNVTRQSDMDVANDIREHIDTVINKCKGRTVKKPRRRKSVITGTP